MTGNLPIKVLSGDEEPRGRCTHHNVEYRRIKLSGGLCRDSWVCATCEIEFQPLLREKGLVPRWGRGTVVIWGCELRWLTRFIRKCRKSHERWEYKSLGGEIRQGEFHPDLWEIHRLPNEFKVGDWFECDGKIWQCCGLSERGIESCGYYFNPQHCKHIPPPKEEKPTVKRWVAGEIAVVPPVEGGFHWWEINEPAANKTWASISADCPDAERYARDIAAMIECARPIPTRSKEEKPSQERKVMPDEARADKRDSKDVVTGDSPSGVNEMIEWVEPFGPGNEPVYMRVSKATAIACQKKLAEQQGKPYSSDEDALDDFCAVHLAQVVETSKNPFTGPHWDAQEYLKEETPGIIVEVQDINTAQCLCDLRDEINRQRKEQKQ